MDDELQKIAEGKSDTKTSMAVFAVTMKQTRDDVQDVKHLLTNEYVTKDGIAGTTNELDRRVKLLETVVFGAVKLILTAFAIGLIATVIAVKAGS